MAGAQEAHDAPVSLNHLLFTVHMVQRRTERFWQRQRVPGDHDRLKPVAAHIELAACV